MQSSSAQFSPTTNIKNSKYAKFCVTIWSWVFDCKGYGIKNSIEVETAIKIIGFFVFLHNS